MDGTECLRHQLSMNAGSRGGVSRDCVTSVPAHTTFDKRAVSSRRVFLAFTLRGLPELAA